VRVAARHLSAEVVKVLAEGHAAALRQGEAVHQPVGVGAGVAALLARELLRRVHARLLPAQGVGVFIAGKRGDGVGLRGGETM